MWIVGANKLQRENLAWGLIPPLAASVLFFVSAVWDAVWEWMASGGNTRWIEVLCEGWVMSSGMIIFAYYLVSVTTFLKMKVHMLEETRKKMEEAMAARNTFMSHISHEFRCPIMSSMGCLELLKETPLSESQHEMVDTISESNSVLLMLIEDILQLVRIEHENREEGTATIVALFNL